MTEYKPPPRPITTFNITCRVSRRKFVFKRAGIGGVTLPNEKVAYTIVAPPTWAVTKGNHHPHYVSLTYAGDNPKYNPSPLVAIMRRGKWWKTITHTLDGDIADQALSLERERAEEKQKSKNKVRKAFCMGEKELNFKGVKAVEVAEAERKEKRVVEMKHTGHRKYEISINERKYRMTGTRRYSIMGVKGCTLGVKMTRVEDGKLIAGLATAMGWVDSFGMLEIFEVDAEMDELVLVQTMWSMVEAEFRKREAIVKTIADMLGNADGG
ncbi:hypothetical protein BZA77DRAFT_310570 [Pyronema omphalodes]|nr:hypothetical protein BZA77DRAFT_310570 [Pyronema omphalodes]